MVHRGVSRTLGIGYGKHTRNGQFIRTHSLDKVFVVAIVGTSQTIYLEVTELLVEVSQEVTVDFRCLTVIVTEVTIGIIDTVFNGRELIGEEGIDTDTSLKLLPIGRFVPQR